MYLHIHEPFDRFFWLGLCPTVPKVVLPIGSRTNTATQLATTRRVTGTEETVSTPPSLAGPTASRGTPTEVRERTV